jgi:hypothetical protein
MPAVGAATREANRSYREVLRSNPRVAGLLQGDLLGNVGTGMILVRHAMTTGSMVAAPLGLTLADP